MRLKKIRESRGLTQDALARKAGISRAYLARLEMGRHDPHLSRLRTPKPSASGDGAAGVTTTWKPWTPSARGHCSCCKALLSVAIIGPALCPECAADRCRRGRRHRTKTYDTSGRAAWVPAGR